MHPGFIGFWQRHRAGHHHHMWAEGACDPQAGCHDGRGHSHDWHHSAPVGDEVGSFGVRRPLRFLAHKLELTDEQVTKLATILSALKTERAQAEVDQRRRVAALAGAFDVNVLDLEQLQSAGQLQVETAQRLKAAVTQALQQIHAMLDEAQRKEFAYLLRTGVLSI